MARSNRRKKQDRAKASARRAEQSRLQARAERQQQVAGRYSRLLDPQSSPAEVAELLAAELPDSIVAGASRVELFAPDDEAERWVLGRVTPGEGRIRVRVNSQRRLARLVRAEFGRVR